MHYDVVYLKKYEGQEKGHWITIGKAFPNEDGRIEVKLDAMPINLGWNGRLVLYPKEEK